MLICPLIRIDALDTGLLDTIALEFVHDLPERTRPAFCLFDGRTIADRLGSIADTSVAFQLRRGLLDVVFGLLVGL